MHNGHAEPINFSIYTISYSVLPFVLKKDILLAEKYARQSVKFTHNLLLYIDNILKRIEDGVESETDFIHVIKMNLYIPDAEKFIIDIILDLIDFYVSRYQGSKEKKYAPILELLVEILNTVTHIPNNKESRQEHVEAWAILLQKWKNKILFTTILTIFNSSSSRLASKCSKTLFNVLHFIPDCNRGHDADGEIDPCDETISNKLIDCTRTLLEHLLKASVEVEWSPWGDEFERSRLIIKSDLQSILLDCLIALVGFDETTVALYAGELTRMTLPKIILEIWQPALECVSYLSVASLSKNEVTKITRLAFILLIQIPKCLPILFTLGEINDMLCQHDDNLKPLLPRILEFAIKHNDQEMVNLALWFTSLYYDVNTDLNQSVYWFYGNPKNKEDEIITNSIEDFKREAGKIITFLNKFNNFNGRQYELAMKKLRAYTISLLSNITDPKRQCDTIIQCSEIWRKLSPTIVRLLSYNLLADAGAISLDIFNEISRIDSHEKTSSKWRDTAISVILKASSGDGKDFLKLILDTLSAKHFIPHVPCPLLCVVRMMSSMVGGAPYFYPQFIDGRICSALLINLDRLQRSSLAEHREYTNKEIDDVKTGTARIMNAWGCNYPEECFEKFGHHSREQFDNLQLLEFYKRYLGARKHKCRIMKTFKTWRMRWFQLSYHFDCLYQWVMIIFGLYFLIADVQSGQFELTSFVLDLAVFILSFLCTVFINYMSFKNRLKHNRETFTSDSIIWEGPQPDDGSTTLKYRLRHYFKPYSNNFKNNLCCFLQMRLILDAKEILGHKPQPVKLLKRKIRNLSTLKLYLKLGAIAGVILQSLVISNFLLAIGKLDQRPYKHGTDIQNGTSDQSGTFLTILNSPVVMKLKLAWTIITLLWSLYSTSGSLTTFEINSMGSGKRKYNLLRVHYTLAMLCRIVVVNMVYSVSGKVLFLFLAAHTILTFMLNLLSSHRYYDTTIDEEKQKRVPQRGMILRLKRVGSYGSALSLLLRLAVLSMSEILIIPVRHPIDLIEGIYHQWHEKEVKDLVPMFVLRLLEMILLSAILDSSNITFLVISFVLNWTLKIFYLSESPADFPDLKSEYEGNTFCDEI